MRDIHGRAIMCSSLEPKCEERQQCRQDRSISELAGCQLEENVLLATNKVKDPLVGRQPHYPGDTDGPLIGHNVACFTMHLYGAGATEKQRKRLLKKSRPV